MPPPTSPTATPEPMSYLARATEFIRNYQSSASRTNPDAVPSSHTAADSDRHRDFLRSFDGLSLASSNGPRIVRVSNHRPVSQHDWTSADLASLRREREEAEQVRDLYYAHNGGANMSGIEDGPTDAYELPDPAELMAIQASADQDRDGDIRMSQVEIYRMHETNNYQERHLTWPLCYVSHVEGYHPENGCMYDAPPEAEDDSDTMSISSDGSSIPGEQDLLAGVYDGLDIIHPQSMFGLGGDTGFGQGLWADTTDHDASDMVRDWVARAESMPFEAAVNYTTECEEVVQDFLEDTDEDLAMLGDTLDALLLEARRPLGYRLTGSWALGHPITDAPDGWNVPSHFMTRFERNLAGEDLSDSESEDDDTEGDDDDGSSSMSSEAPPFQPGMGWGPAPGIYTADMQF